MKTLDYQIISFKEFTDFMLSGKSLHEDVIRDLTVSHCQIYDVPKECSVFIIKSFRSTKYFLGFFPYLSTYEATTFNGLLLSNVFIKENIFSTEEKT